MKQNKSLAAALEVAGVQKLNLHRERAKREGITYLEAKARNLAEAYHAKPEKVNEIARKSVERHVKTYGSTPEQFALDVQQMIITLPEKPNKLATGHLTPAYGRLCITSAHVLDWFNRGFDFENNDPHVPGRYCSIRDFALGAQIQFRYGKRLQKTFIYIIPQLNGGIVLTTHKS